MNTYCEESLEVVEFTQICGRAFTAPFHDVRFTVKNNGELKS